MSKLEKVVEFHVDLEWDGESGGRGATSLSHTVVVDTAKAFGGKGRHLCPDELLLSSAGGCMLTTFLYFKERLKLPLKALRVKVDSRIELTPKGYEIKGININMHIQVEEGWEAEAERCAELTKRYCHITRMLEKAVPIVVKFQTSAGK